ncbi:MAG: terminase small subunit-like protein [Bauldia sp.]
MTQSAPSPSRAGGRSTRYGEALVEEILARLALGESLRSICRTPGMPDESTVRLWAIEDREGFAARYARARDLGLDALADVLLAIPDEAPDAPSGRLRFEVLRWYLSKLAPKRYGDRVEAAAKASLSHEEALRELE